MATAKELGFETETCSRCHGSGRYSYCQEHGDRCFGCGGTGIVLTKRGAAAWEFYRASCEIAAAEVAVGMTIIKKGITVGGAPYEQAVVVKAVEVGREFKSNSTVPPTIKQSVVFTVSAKGREEKYGLATDYTVRRVYPVAERAPLIAAALAYQATLTKAGTARASGRPNTTERPAKAGHLHTRRGSRR